MHETRWPHAPDDAAHNASAPDPRRRGHDNIPEDDGARRWRDGEVHSQWLREKEDPKAIPIRMSPGRDYVAELESARRRPGRTATGRDRRNRPRDRRSLI